jgi:hypothetical protein
LTLRRRHLQTNGAQALAQEQEGPGHAPLRPQKENVVQNRTHLHIREACRHLEQVRLERNGEEHGRRRIPLNDPLEAEKPLEPVLPLHTNQRRSAVPQEEKRNQVREMLFELLQNRLPPQGIIGVLEIELNQPPIREQLQSHPRGMDNLTSTVGDINRELVRQEETRVRSRVGKLHRPSNVLVERITSHDGTQLWGPLLRQLLQRVAHPPP